MDLIKKFFENEKIEKSIINLIEVSELDSEFFIMSGLSGLLAMTGVLLNDNIIIIAATVLAPLLNPILAFAAGLSLLNIKLLIYATKSILLSTIFIIIITFLFQKALISLGLEFDISFYTTKLGTFNVLFLVTAFLSGFAGVYTWIQETKSLNLVGVAIAVAIIPFVSLFGILVGSGKYNILLDILNNFLYNMLFIIGGAVIAFMFFGVFSRRKRINKDAENEITQ